MPGGSAASPGGSEPDNVSNEAELRAEFTGLSGAVLAIHTTGDLSMLMRLAAPTSELKLAGD